jgi:hemolysin III
MTPSSFGRSASSVVCHPSAAPAARRGEISWDYDGAELIADALVHAAGVVLGLLGAIGMAFIASGRGPREAAPLFVYVASLVTMLGISAAYNVWPVSAAKWLLRRFDHAAIYLLIAGTYTPFLAQMQDGLAAVGLGIGLWASAAFGIGLKLLLPGRFDRLSVGLYVLLGWSGVLAYQSFAAAIPRGSVWLLWIGGALYSVGIVFHAWGRLRFQNVIWHGFVLLAAICHYLAVLGVAVR